MSESIKTANSPDEMKADIKDNHRLQLSAAILLKGYLPDQKCTYTSYCVTITIFAFILRFYRINYPSEVVFDEVHFGKFASFYLEGRYFFDLHPPLAKLYFALIGYLVGYNGSFKFDDISYSYFDANGNSLAPYIWYRCTNVVLGTLIVPLVFNTLKELNCRAITCLLAGILIAIDNAQVIQTRFIFLDTPLLLSIASAIYCYVRFYKYQVMTDINSFDKTWYMWLILTGISLSCAISTKYVGVMTYISIGVAVVYNLWQMLDLEYGLRMRVFIRHFLQRLNYLVMLPFLIYLFWFWMHFKILVYTSDDNQFMSETFQDTLLYNSSLFTINGQYIVNYFDVVTIRHDFTDVFLGSLDTDGKVVGLYEHDIRNNEWQILPTSNVDEDWPVVLGDQIQLKNIETGQLLSWSNAIGLKQEIITIDEQSAQGDLYYQSLFQFLPLRDVDMKHEITSNRTIFKIYNPYSQNNVYTTNDTASIEPEFVEIKLTQDKNFMRFTDNDWKIYGIINLPSDRDITVVESPSYVPFFNKWSELQISMFMHNNELSADHPFASNPYTWPMSLNGVLYWTEDTERKQIYFIGNIIGWCFQSLSLAVYIITIMIDIFTRKRQIYILSDTSRERIYGPILFLFICWAFHYFPFYLMERQKFLHHYLPAHLIASMFSAMLCETLLTNIVSKDGKQHKKNIKTRWLNYFVILLTIMIICCFIYFIPTTYGEISLTAQKVKEREWFNIKLNFTD